MGKENQPKQEFKFGLYQGIVYEAQDLNGKADPFVQVRAIKTDGTYSKVLFKSTVKKATLNPAWNEYDKIKVKDYVNDLLVELYDEDLVKNDFIGRQIISMGRVRSGIFDEVVKFEDDKNNVKGTVRIKIERN
ncbi:C2 domain-containing protein [Dictyostelium discoideum AX4]|uniref:C2 domain-containing protein n=1 Tax=Dictyostelium discoideum TaxID=44689 RepID=Q54YT1_DICDI|nr:C2 domain-containing protein [Dictyostelium discoideum AX4]EAL68223.1 C2 domain-containing protein [Dictyostelium discoideum AX4]|eukprot:XP_642121.1 C2 domain-containing protein [Dictyostelium discoideum AX4]